MNPALRTDPPSTSSATMGIARVPNQGTTEVGPQSTCGKTHPISTQRRSSCRHGTGAVAAVLCLAFAAPVSAGHEFTRAPSSHFLKGLKHVVRKVTRQKRRSTTESRFRVDLAESGGYAIETIQSVSRQSPEAGNYDKLMQLSHAAALLKQTGKAKWAHDLLRSIVRDPTLRNDAALNDLARNLWQDLETVGQRPDLSTTTASLWAEKPTVGNTVDMRHFLESQGFSAMEVFSWHRFGGVPTGKHVVYSSGYQTVSHAPIRSFIPEPDHEVLAVLNLRKNWGRRLGKLLRGWFVANAYNAVARFKEKESSPSDDMLLSPKAHDMPFSSGENSRLHREALAERRRTDGVLPLDNRTLVHRIAKLKVILRKSELFNLEAIQRVTAFEGDTFLLVPLKDNREHAVWIPLRDFDPTRLYEDNLADDKYGPDRATIEMRIKITTAVLRFHREHGATPSQKNAATRYAILHEDAQNHGYYMSPKSSKLGCVQLVELPSNQNRLSFGEQIDTHLKHPFRDPNFHTKWISIPKPIRDLIVRHATPRNLAKSLASRLIQEVKHEKTQQESGRPNPDLLHFHLDWVRIPKDTRDAAMTLLNERSPAIATEWRRIDARQNRSAKRWNPNGIASE